MLRSVDCILGYQVSSLDGIAGTVTDILLTDNLQSVPFLVILTGGWLDPREVLVPTENVCQLVAANKELHVDLTLERIQEAPNIDTHLAPGHSGCRVFPVLSERFPDWLPDPLPGMALAIEAERPECDGSTGLPQLYRLAELTACEVELGDSRGRISDAIVCDLDWTVTGLVVTKGKGRTEATNLLARNDLQGVFWEERLIRVRKGCQMEPFSANSPVNPRRIVRYFDYFGQFHHAVIADETQRSGRRCSER